MIPWNGSGKIHSLRKHGGILSFGELTLNKDAQFPQNFYHSYVTEINFGCPWMAATASCYFAVSSI
jgi:hypothetical protein